MKRLTTRLGICLSLGGMAICSVVSMGCDQGLAEPYMPLEESTGTLAIEEIPIGGSEVFVNLGDRSLGFSSAPTAVVIRVSSSGGYAAPSEVPTYQVFGDGRVEKRYRGRDPETVAQLGTVGVAGLLELAVEGGLMEWDQEDVESRVFNAIGGRYSNPDASTQKIEIFLTFYRDVEGTESRPTSRVIESYDTVTRSEIAPDIPELQAAWGIYRALMEAGQ